MPTRSPGKGNALLKAVGCMGYQDFLKTVNDPKHPDDEQMWQWAMLAPGELWDTNSFDEQAVKEVVARY